MDVILRRKKSVVCSKKVYADVVADPKPGKKLYELIKSGGVYPVGYCFARGKGAATETTYLSDTGDKIKVDFPPVRRVKQSDASQPIGETLDNVCCNINWADKKPHEIAKYLWDTPSELVSINVGKTEATNHILYTTYLVDGAQVASIDGKNTVLGITIVGDRAVCGTYRPSRAAGGGDRVGKTGRPRPDSRQGPPSRNKHWRGGQRNTAWMDSYKGCPDIGKERPTDRRGGRQKPVRNKPPQDKAPRKKAGEA